jgi:hypothetical protein
MLQAFPGKTKRFQRFLSAIGKSVRQDCDIPTLKYGGAERPSVPDDGALFMLQLPAT